MPFASIILVSATLLMSPGPARAAESGEYPVAYWGQTHIPQAVYLHKSLTAENFRTACRKGLSSIPADTISRKQDLSRLAKEWKHFARGSRLAFCRAHPHTAWYLLGEAPYFMLPARPGVQR